MGVDGDMPVWLWFVDSLAVVVVLLLVAVTWLVVRRRVITRRSGAAFDLAVNRRPSGDSWILGFAIYRDTELHWFRTFSMSFRPRYRFVRGEVSIEGRRAPEGAEERTLPSDHLVVTTENHVGVQQLALSAGALTGLLAWLESSPPGQRVSRVV